MATTKKISTQRIHGALRTANFITEKYAPSQKINRSGYRIQDFFKGQYSITIWNSGADTIDYNLDEMLLALTSKGIIATITENKNNGEKWIAVKKFQ